MMAFDEVAIKLYQISWPDQRMQVLTAEVSSSARNFVVESFGAEIIMNNKNVLFHYDSPRKSELKNYPLIIGQGFFVHPVPMTALAC